MEINSTQKLPITCIIPIYIKNTKDEAARSISSIIKQTKVPAELIVAVDGPISDEVDKYLHDLESDRLITTFRSEINIGLANILNRAIGISKFSIIMRLDADDWSSPTRCEQQYGFMLDSGCDVCGTYTIERHTDGDRVKEMPLGHDEIKRYSRRRNPINHPSAMFRREVWQECNGYPNEKYFEDFALWLKALKRGFIFSNIPDTLVTMTLSDSDLRRRSGLKYAGFEVLFYVRRLFDGTVPPTLVCSNIILKPPLRLLPHNLFVSVYKYFRRKPIH